MAVEKEPQEVKKASQSSLASSQQHDDALPTTEEPTKEAQDDEFPTDWRKVLIIMLSLYLTMFLVALDRLIIGTAIPAITDDFHAINDVAWYAGAYLLTSSAFQLISGRIYTFYSPKWVMLVAILIFEVGSAICGAAPNSTSLIIGRAIAGLGSAGIFGGCVTIMLYTIPLHKRPLYQGFFGAVFGVASISGPLLGGLFTDKLTWRWCFYINIPVGAVIVLVLLFAVKTKTKPNDDSFRERFLQLDPLGTLLFLPGVICLLLALQWGGRTYAWSNGRIIALFVISFVLLVAFVVVQFRVGEHATIPIRIIKQRSVAAGAYFAFILSGGMITLVYFLPIWFQAIKGDSAVRSGIHTLPLVLSLVVSSIISGVLIKKTGYYVPQILVSTVLLAVGSGLISTFKPNTPSSQWIGYQVVFGAGLGLGMQVPNLAAQTVLNKTDAITGIALMFFAQGIGGSIFVAIAQALFTSHLTSGLSHIDGLEAATVLKTGATELRHLVPEAMIGQVLEVYNEALRRTFQVAIGCTCASIIGAVCMEWRSMKGLQEGGDVVKADRDNSDVEKGSRRNSQNADAEKV